MITQKEEHLENTANVQIEAMSDVLNKLRTKAGVYDYPEGFYWFSRTDYAQVDRNGNLECWERGYGNNPNFRSGYSLEVDDQLLADGDVVSFKERFRKKMLPAFNKMRLNQLQSTLVSIASHQRRIQELTGDIE
jgi:hypothetical protein